MKFNFVSSGKKANIEGAQLLVNNNNLYVEEKFDGSRFGLELEEDGWHAYSRGGIDRIKNIPYIREQLEEMQLPVGTVLDCEVIVFHSIRKKCWELTRSVMGTNTYNPEAEKAHLLIFDIQHIGEEDYTNRPWIDRRSALKELFGEKEKVGHETYYIVKDTWLAYPRAYSLRQLERLWEYIVTEHDGEGVMLKNARLGKYGKDWTKVKKEYTIDCFVIGTTKGKGKYEGQIGALEVAVYNGETIWPIGKISSLGDDDNRKLATDLALAHKLKGRVIEVKFNEVTKNKQLRHGRFMRWRDDKPKEECLLEQLDVK
jgi:ATP-dependent DNA ligase